MISLALDRYDRHLPFFDGTVLLPATLQNLRVYQVGQHGALRDGAHRHERMLRGAYVRGGVHRLVEPRVVLPDRPSDFAA